MLRNLHVLIVGQTGSGKTVLAKALLALSERVVVLDRKCEYELDGAIVCYNFKDASAAFLENRWRGFVLVFRPYEEHEYIMMLELLEHTQKVEPHGPLVICLEEASNYSDAATIDETVRQLYNAGRHLRINMLTIAQSDTDIHRITRKNSPILVTMQQNELSGNFRDKFDLERVVNLHNMQTSGYDPNPRAGVHYLTNPENVDLYKEWYDVTGYRLEQTSS